jgi:squalene-hopene/tetraprenyl-beta-curcumene cyclase
MLDHAGAQTRAGQNRVAGALETIASTRLQAALAKAARALLAEIGPHGHWAGELSASALSTATAVTALATVDREHHASLIEGGLRWLAEHRNADGGWGDTVRSISNISTTALCWAAFGAARADENFRDVVTGAEMWLARSTGFQPVRTAGVSPAATCSGSTADSAEPLARAIAARYGKDRTFSVPILMTLAIGGRLGENPWRRLIHLPFEFAALPHQIFGALRLPVVSYALPALIAIGQAIHHHAPTRNPLTRLLRNISRERTLRTLAEIQPPNGGFLEATPLTSFVTMALASMGLGEHPVAQKGVEFLRASVRADGSWPIDTNLATWVTTLAVEKFAHTALDAWLSPQQRGAIRDWLLAQQYRVEHPYTHAAPGGWAWTDLPGGVPDADDTAGALLALRHLAEHCADAGAKRSSTFQCRDSGALHPPADLDIGMSSYDTRLRSAATAAVTWLLDVQNRDGGIPTFCRGWGALPFDRSAPDLAAHAVRAWLAWRDDLPEPCRRRTQRAIRKAVAHLARTQRPDGSWAPLWFGNQHARDDENPTYGTSRVALALQELSARGDAPAAQMLARAGEWLVAAQNSDGGWGGARGVSSSVEETAWAVEALAGFGAGGIAMPAIERALFAGLDWLIGRVETGEWREPSPVGFYFAKLWYFERLYPLIFTVGALGKCCSRPL